MSVKVLPLGPLMIDIAGTTLTASEAEKLCHPLVGGIILFSRNYENPVQLSALCESIHALRTPPLPIAIDHEGGRVQRCREGFTRLPAMRELGLWWQGDRTAAIDGAHAIGYLLAAELRQCGVDFSFTPVLDLEWGRSSVIGDRAFHSDATAVTELARALIKGLKAAGLGCCGKHFPGHGWVSADSHVAQPIDERSLAELAPDIFPYRHLPLDAVMPAHVVYPQIDSRPAGFSPVWLDFLRRDLGFGGVIFSDDLSMEGAGVVGGIVARVEAAWSAGCDMLLVCNSPEAVTKLLAEWHPMLNDVSASRIEKLSPKSPWTMAENLYASGVTAIATISSRVT